MNNVFDDPWYTPSRAVLVAKTCIDCGKFLGVNEYWINKGRRRSECRTCSAARHNREPVTASHVPSTGILLAKTCPQCGKFLMAHAFWRNGKPGRTIACKRCMKHRRYRYTQAVAA